MITAFYLIISFAKWYELAIKAEKTKMKANESHHYFETGIGVRENDGFISKDLPDFADKNNNFFVFNNKENKGVQCRVG